MLQGMQGEVQSMKITTIVSMWLTALVAGIGIVIGVLSPQKRKLIVKILGVTVTVIIATTNIIFDEDHRALKLRSSRMDAHLEGVEEALMNIKSTPPLITYDEFVEKF